MRNKYIIIAFLLLGMLFISACGDSSEATENATEADNQTETNENEADEEESDHRIVATTYAIVEFMEALDIDVVGVPTTYKEIPERYEDATEVGNAMDPDLETVLSLDPTHVLTVTNLQSDLEEPFTEHNVPADYLDLDTVDGMFQELEKLGEEYNRSKEAEKIITDFEEKMEEVEALVEGKDSPKVLILMGIPGSYIVGTEHSYIGDLVEQAGGENAVTDKDQDFISANTEYLQQLDPDIILRAVHGAPEEVVKMFDEEFAQNDIWKHFDAVKNDRVYDLEETLFGTTANLAVDEAMDELLKILYPSN